MEKSAVRKRVNKIKRECHTGACFFTTPLDLSPLHHFPQDINKSTVPGMHYYIQLNANSFSLSLYEHVCGFWANLEIRNFLRPSPYCLKFNFLRLLFFRWPFRKQIKRIYNNAFYYYGIIVITALFSLFFQKLLS